MLGCSVRLKFNSNLETINHANFMSDHLDTYWVYILHCENNSYYTGYTTNLARRYQEHLNGTAKCKYTRSFKPLKIAQTWQFTEKSRAMKMEKLIKQLSKKDKELLILFPDRLLSLVAASNA